MNHEATRPGIASPLLEGTSQWRVTGFELRGARKRRRSIRLPSSWNMTPRWRGTRLLPAETERSAVRLRLVPPTARGVIGKRTCLKSRFFSVRIRACRLRAPRVGSETLNLAMRAQLPRPVPSGGEAGRHAGSRCPCSKEREGSNPFLTTMRRWWNGRHPGLRSRRFGVRVRLPLCAQWRRLLRGSARAVTVPVATRGRMRRDSSRFAGGCGLRARRRCSWRSRRTPGSRSLPRTTTLRTIAPIVANATTMGGSPFGCS